MSNGKGNRVPPAPDPTAFAAIMGAAIYEAARQFAAAAPVIAQTIIAGATNFASATAALRDWSPNGRTIPPIPPIEDAD